jgi:23S rRNA (cytosine1962-C5)-methyltransferase
MQALLDAIAALGLPTDAARLFHGRGGLHPGCEHLALDWYPPVLVLTSFQPLDDGALALVHDALAARWQQLAPATLLAWVYQQRVMAGSVPDPHVVTENGARFKGACAARPEPRPVSGHGRRPPLGARLRGRSTAQDRYGLKVLNLFAYTCAFSVVALQGGRQGRWSTWT